MTLTTALRNAVRAEKEISTGVRVTGENIANAENPDYHRIRTVYNARPFGGLDQTVLRREANALLEQHMRSHAAVAGHGATFKQLSAEIARSLGVDGDTVFLDARMNALKDAFLNLQANPQAQSAHAQTVFAANDLLSEITSLSTDLVRLRDTVLTQIQQEVTTMNQLVTRINGLNDQIVRTRSTPGNAAAQTMRDAAINELAQHIDLRIQTDHRNRVSIFTATGQQLTGKLDVYPFHYNRSAHTLSVGSIVVATNDGSTNLGVGSLQARFDFIRSGAENTLRNEPQIATIERLERQLDAFAAALVSEEPGSFAYAFRQPTVDANGIAPQAQGWEPTFAHEALFDVDLDIAAPRNRLSVHASYLNGSERIPTVGLSMTEPQLNIITALTTTLQPLAAQDFDLSPNQLPAQATYHGVITHIVNVFNTQYQYASEQDLLFTEQRDRLRQEFSNEIGVSIDEEIAQLTQLQNAYAANARVISVVNELFEEIINAVR